MKTLEQYREDIKNLMKKTADIDAKAVAENREHTEAELALKNEIMDTVDDLRKIVSTQERQERISAALEKPEPALTRQRNPAGAVAIVDRQQKFGSFGEQMSAVMRAGMPGGSVDPRLFNIRGAASGLSESVPSDGGLR